MVALILLFAAGSATGDGDWDVQVDAGALAGNTYLGSDEYFVTPLPAIRASRTTKNTTWFISLPLEGVGVSHRNPASGLTTSLAMNFGGSRGPEEYSVLGFPVEHSDRIRTLLAGSSEVTTPVVFEAKLEYPVPFGSLGTSLGYPPISIDSRQTQITDDVRHGFLLSLQHKAIIPVTRKLVAGSVLALELMDGNYAEAWYSVSRETRHLAEYEAKAGAQDIQATLFASYQVTRKINLTLFYRHMLLLGDAANCPYTLDESQQSYLLRTSYSF